MPEDPTDAEGAGRWVWLAAPPGDWAVVSSRTLDILASSFNVIEAVAGTTLGFGLAARSS